MKKIIGVTIGPIIETISESRKIFEIANGSLFFSNIIYEFLNEVDKRKIDYNIITPSFKVTEKKEERFYPDRVVIECISLKEEKTILEEMESIYNDILEKERLKDLEDYINFNIIVAQMEENQVKDIFKKLDGAELIKNFPISYRDGVINKKIASYFENKKSLNLMKFNIDYSISSVEKERSYDSQDGYRAVIALDIDNMGQFSQNSIGEIKDISKAIYEYIESLNKFFKSKKEDDKEEGMVLYSAGDDILAVLNPKYVFEFIEVACRTLNEKFKNFKNDKLSVSIGVFICYAKYPIKEAINQANRMLFEKAKENKNSVALLFQKHSGQSFEIVINNLLKKGRVFNEDNKIFNKLKEDVREILLEQKERKLLNTIIQKVSLNTFIFKEIIEDDKRIECFLKTLFESNKEEENILNDLYELLSLVGKNKENTFEYNLEQVLSFFKILKFYTGRE